MTRMLAVLGGVSLGLLLGLAAPAAATHLWNHGCPSDSVRVGTACIDKWEASLWQITTPPMTPAQNTAINRIRAGTVTMAHLTAAGATQLGLTLIDLTAAGCPFTGNNCIDVYAVSIPGVQPANRGITWFQATAAARNSYKRLPTNQEWTAAALGTPDGAPCNVSNGTIANTGSASGCVSEVGAFDMVGNVQEWVADWVPLSTNCVAWSLLFSDDFNCLAGADTTLGPGALIRGGTASSFTGAGVFAVEARTPPNSPVAVSTGFRGAR